AFVSLLPRGWGGGNRGQKGEIRRTLSTRGEERALFLSRNGGTRPRGREGVARPVVERAARRGRAPLAQSQRAGPGSCRARRATRRTRCGASHPCSARGSRRQTRRDAGQAGGEPG